MVGGNFPPLPPRGLDFEGVSVLHGPFQGLAKAEGVSHKGATP